MTDRAALALLTLAELPRVGERTVTRIRQLLSWNGVTLGEFLRLPPSVLALEFELPKAALVRLSRERARHDDHCRRVLDRLRAAGARITEPGDPAYPIRWLRRADHPPPIVFSYGSPLVLEPPTLSILNSRVITEGAVTATLQVARCAGRDGFTVAVGGMKTTHRITAVSVRAVGAPRAIVLDRGLFAVFRDRLEVDPFGLAPGRVPFDPRTTLVLSPFRPDDHAAPGNGRRRDELIAALSDVLVIASARPGGEVERISLRALDRGQCVLVWQGANDGLVAAGATAIDEGDLSAGLLRFLPS